MNFTLLTDEQLTQNNSPKRFMPPTLPEYEGKNMVYFLIMKILIILHVLNFTSNFSSLNC